MRESDFMLAFRNGLLAQCAIGLVLSQAVVCAVAEGEDVQASGLDGPSGCGEVAVALVAEAYGCQYSREEIRTLLQPGALQETSLTRIWTALSALGLEAHMVKGNIDVLRATGRPAILLVQSRPSDPVGHFAVVRWDEGGEPMVFDPLLEGGPVSVKPEDLNRVWTGYAVVIMEPVNWGGRLLVVISLAGAMLGYAAGVWLPQSRRSSCTAIQHKQPFG